MADNTNHYKGYPLIRKDNDLWLGYHGDPYAVWIHIEHETAKKVSDKVKVYLMPNKENGLPEKQATRFNLYDALDLAAAWLNRV